MRALTSSVISFELLILILFIPAALQNESVETSLIIATSTTLFFLGFIILGVLRKKIGLILGYFFQILFIGLGYFVTWMYLLGIIFLVLWVLAIKIGKKTDSMKRSVKSENETK